MKQIFIEPIIKESDRYKISIKCSLCNQTSYYRYIVKSSEYPLNIYKLINKAATDHCHTQSCQHNYTFNELEEVSFRDTIGDYKYIAYITKGNPNGFTFLHNGQKTFCVFNNKTKKESRNIQLIGLERRKFNETKQMLCEQYKRLFPNAKPNKKKDTQKSAPYYSGIIHHENCNCQAWEFVSEDSFAIELRCCACGYSTYITTELLDKHFKRSNSNPYEKRFTYVDVIVLSTYRKCISLDHSLSDVQGILDVTRKDGSHVKEKVHLSYCSECQRYILRTGDYNKLNGFPNCTVRDLRSGKIVYEPYVLSDLSYDLSPHSILNKQGYNVRSGNGLSSIDRQEILIRVIEQGILSRGEVCDHLNYLINMNSDKANLEGAVRKWQMDLDFVESYNFSTESQVNINSITLKGKK